LFTVFLLATVVTTVTPGGPPFDLTITGSNSYRPLTYTEKVFTDEWAKKLSTTNNHSKEPIINNQHQGLSEKKTNFFLTVGIFIDRFNRLKNNLMHIELTFEDIFL
jgi:hypothetical protein